MNYKIMGINIAKKRVENHLTQEQLAEIINVSTVFISQTETAVRKPSLETVYKLSSALNTTIDNLIGNESHQSQIEEIISLLENKNKDEISFVTNIVREICLNTNNGKITIK